jgi:hypothetical protein
MSIEKCVSANTRAGLQESYLPVTVKDQFQVYLFCRMLNRATHLCHLCHQLFLTC